MESQIYFIGSNRYCGGGVTELLVKNTNDELSHILPTQVFLIVWGRFYSLNVGLKEIFQVVDSWCKELTGRWTVLTYLLVLDGNRRCGTLGPTARSNNPCQSEYIFIFSSFE